LVGAQGPTADSLATLDQAAVLSAVDRVTESVVQIRTIGGLDTIDGALRADGPTTGLVISPEGHIISSAFNFSEQPASILVTLPSGKQVPAELVAKDHSRMLVLLKVNDAAELPVPEFAPADEIRVGQWAIAVGRTFRADRTNLAVGIVSARDRMFGKVLQTDAAVSTANYGGPLVDIRGRVLGILVPMAPQNASDVAGVEWYDSGIGFAVPLTSITAAVERMKRGEDQRAGILGIGMAGNSPHDSPAELAVVRPDSPAGQAGLRSGDRIVEINGAPIKTQTDLRFALGPRYGGESVQLVALRGEERIERTLVLAAELAVFRHAFLGMLPMRIAAEPLNEDKGDAQQLEHGQEAAIKSPAEDSAGSAPAAGDAQPIGVVVRMVYPDSPAAKAGIQTGDRMVRIGEMRIDDLGDAIQEMNNVAPSMVVHVRVLRKGEPLDLTLTAGQLPAPVPKELPPAFAAEAVSEANQNEHAQAAEGQTKAGKTLELKLTEFKQNCQIYIPVTHEPQQALGVLLWLHAPGASKPETTIRDWRQICDRDGLVLVVPTAAGPDRWERIELEYLRRLLERVLGQYTTDSRRVVIYGQEGGGAMAYLLALSSRDLVRGVATSATPLPRQLRVPENEPSVRFAVLAGLPSGGSDAQIAQGLRKLADAGYPVTTVAIANPTGNLSAEEREQLARWIDTLDRF
jgi:serine protease Do